MRMKVGLDPNEVLANASPQQKVEVRDEGFAENAEEVLDKEFENMYSEFMHSDFVKSMDHNELFQKCRDYYDNLPNEKKKQFIEHCLIDMTTIHLNAISQIVQIRQNLFTDTYSKDPKDALDSRWMDIFLYQIIGLALSTSIPSPVQAIKQQKG